MPQLFSLKYRKIVKRQSGIVHILPVLVLLLLATGIVVGVQSLNQNTDVRSQAQVATPTLPPLPASWPAVLHIGHGDGPGGAASMKNKAPFGFRYQYLAGGVNTGNGWANWNANGQFVTYYIQDSIAAGITPLFTYYMMAQSNPGGSGENNAVYNNLQNTPTMTSYYNDFKLLMQRAGAFPNQTVVVHVDPDVWGFVQQRATNDNAATVPAKVASTGLSELAGLPENLTGYARALIKLRDMYAPNVILGYHLSVWGTGVDILYGDPPDTTVDALGLKAGNYYNSLQANFDVVFGEFNDRDAGFKQAQYGDNGGSYYNDADRARNVRFLSKFVATTGKRIALWQIPYGNTKMRAVNNTWNHYQDNHVEYFFDEPARTHLQTYVNAGVIAFMFGRGSDGVTGNCDCNNDGVTNPAPINNNTGVSLNADDDGGFFTQKAQAYYATGPMQLPTGGTMATPTVRPSNTPTPVATATPTTQPTNTPTPLPTNTPTPRPTNTPTPMPTATPTPRPTNTPTPQATATPTVRPTNTATPAPTTPPQTVWTGTYFNNKYFSGTPTFTRNEGINLDRNWGWGSVGSGVGRNVFSARFSKTEAFTGGTYQFSVRHDDGLRIFIDGNATPVYTQWRDQAATNRTFTVAIPAGTHTITAEYYENRGRAEVGVAWSQ